MSSTPASGSLVRSRISMPGGATARRASIAAASVAASTMRSVWGRAATLRSSWRGRSSRIRLAVLVADLVATSEAVAATSARNEKIALLAGALRRLAPDEAAAGVAFLSGELLQRQIGVGWASLKEPAGGKAEPELT